MLNPTIAQYLESVNNTMADNCNDHTVESALQQAIWSNSYGVPDLKQNLLRLPQPCTNKWQGMDNFSRYQQNILDPSKCEQLDENGWLDRTIDYTLNSWGFRSDREYDHVPEQCIVTLGCSFTFGTGLCEEQVWPSLLAQRLGVSLVNLSTPGHGLDLNSLWLILKSQGIMNPIAVCVYEPPPGRISWLEHRSPDAADAVDARGTMFSHTLLDICETDGNINQKSWSMLINNITLNSMTSSVKNFNTISAWAQSRAVPLIWCNGKSNHYSSLARDLAHFGWEWHQFIADWFFDQLKG